MSSVPIDAIVDFDETALFSTPDVCRMAGVSFRQLDYWSRTGVLAPAQPARGSGSQRRFTGAQVRDIAMAGRLRELGVSLDAIEEVLAVVHDAEGALIVIGSASVRVAAPADLAAAVNDADGAAIVVSPDALRIIDVAERKTVPRCGPRGAGRHPFRPVRGSRG